jgi:hypothetical protein
MSRKQGFSDLAAKVYAGGAQPEAPEENSRPDPEEGHRLIRAFLRIKSAAAREAVISFVETLSMRREHETDIHQTPGWLQ